ncbi:Putative armadillo-like helical, Rap1 GTPase-GDP dissociation stimulator 1 [Septoria linicola]|uniref:Armadillo-like helical, Rap1 GTPase-GDP dissociation stimulator 1 n=1 Tax=Septoria linicola TaxID=215465 RepID=A0A9Q9AY40_9PEZI|nr:putative armadillo-like helical, Rap1 GTPase-GDP dissociation stimulator 1 [Septoria linicola]USW55343.1 Putative armadillo-like helical, Rap1 GTPase-GDP dissociation stimulator 1 [Septoria linicola]
MTDQDLTEDIEAALKSLSLDSSTTPLNPQAIQTLATASRQSPAIRQQLSDPSILKTLIETIETSLISDLQTTDLALRCLANASIDNDSARENISTLGFSWALQALSSDDATIQILTTKVLNNICCDHEGAQKACYKDRVHYALLRFLDSKVAREMPMVNKLAGDLDGAVDVLFWVSGQKAALEEKLAEPLPRDVLSGVLGLYELWTEDWDVETFATLSETMLVWLRDEVVQKQVIEEHRFAGVWRLLERQEGVIEELRRAQRQVDEDGARPLPPYCETGEPEEDQKLLVPLQASLVWCLSDIAAQPAFSKEYSWSGEEMQFLIHTIQAAGDSARDQRRSLYPAEYANMSATGQNFNAACQILGNLLWAQQQPQDYASLVKQVELYKDLIDIIALSAFSTTFPDALHSIAGLLVQLSRPSIEAPKA